MKPLHIVKTALLPTMLMALQPFATAQSSDKPPEKSATLSPEQFAKSRRMQRPFERTFAIRRSALVDMVDKDGASNPESPDLRNPTATVMT